MFVDAWCPRCGKAVASNRYKMSEWSDRKWKKHWSLFVEKKQAEHDLECEKR